MNRRSITILISGIITLFVTIVIAALCIDDWSGLTGWAFSSMLLSEIILFGGFIFVERIAERTEQIITRSALYVLFSVYAIINIPVSVLYIAFFKEATTSFVIIEVILLAVVIIAVLICLVTSKSINQSNEMTMNNVLSVESMIERLSKLADSNQCEKYSSALKKAGENLRFTDVSVIVPEDEEIDKAISAIEIDVTGDNEITEEVLNGYLVRLNSLIAKRKIAASFSKKGRV